MSEQSAPAETGHGRPSDSERQLGLLVHLLAFAGWIFPFGNIIAPLVLWAVKKDESEFLDWHGRQSVNFQMWNLWPIPSRPQPSRFCLSRGATRRVYCAMASHRVSAAPKR